MKIHVTQRAIRNSYSNVISVGYCNLQYMLNFKSPEYYTSGTYGWGADIYMVAPDTVIVTGYAPFGNCKPGYELCRKYDLKAEKIIESAWPNYEQQISELEALTQEFVKEALKNENG